MSKADWRIYEQYVAVMDAKTCIRCIANHGRILPKDFGPRPPLHLWCRCRRIFHHSTYHPTLPVKQAPPPPNQPTEAQIFRASPKPIPSEPEVIPEEEILLRPPVKRRIIEL